MNSSLLRVAAIGLMALLACHGSARLHAGILEDIEAAQLVVDFTFDDADGTAIPDLENSANPAAPFDDDSDSDFAAANGLGQLDVSGKANTSFGSHYVDVDTYDSGRMIALFDVSWAFDESIYDSGQDEEFRLTLISNDPRSTFVTAEIFFVRSSATEVTLYGNGTGTEAVDTPDVLLGSSGSLITMLDLDIASRQFELLYSSDGGATFTSAGFGLTGDFDSGTPEIDIRPVDSVRLVLNEDFSDDTMLIERFAVAYVPEPAGASVLAFGGFLIGFLRRR